MASSVGPLSLEDILNEIHNFKTGGTDAPSVSSDTEEYNLRIALVNSYIRTWQNARNGKWRELQDVKTGLTVTASGTTSYPTDATFRRIAGSRGVKLTKANGDLMWVPVVSWERLDDPELDNTIYAYIGGAPGAYMLNLIGIPDDWVGAVIQYRLYRYAKKLIQPANVPDLDDPNYLIHSVAAVLFQLARNNSGYTVHYDLASQAMEGMQGRQAEREVPEEERQIGHRINNIGTFGL